MMNYLKNGSTNCPLFCMSNGLGSKPLPRTHFFESKKKDFKWSIVSWLDKCNSGQKMSVPEIFLLPHKLELSKDISGLIPSEKKHFSDSWSQTGSQRNFIGLDRTNLIFILDWPSKFSSKKIFFFEITIQLKLRVIFSQLQHALD